MCYHTSIKKSAIRELAEKKKLQLNIDIPDIYHVSGFDRPTLPVTLNTEQDAIQGAQWKLIPHWVKTEQEAKKLKPTQNARSEGIFAAPTYRNYIGKYRGLLWIDGFFEPNGQENYYIYRPDHAAFALGVVWAPWRDETGNLTNTFSIITTVPNMPVGNIHDRMPLIIQEQDHKGWLNADGQEQIEHYFRPAPDDYLDHHKIAVRVTAGRQNFNYPGVQDKDLSSGAEQTSLF